MSTYECRTEEQAISEAAKRKCVVVYPGPNELQIDIDCEADLQAFEATFAILRQSLVNMAYIQRVSPSGKPNRFHITVDVGRPVSTAERILLQAILGSDRRREALNWRRMIGGDERPSLFFEHA